MAGADGALADSSMPLSPLQSTLADAVRADLPESAVIRGWVRTPSLPVKSPPVARTALSARAYTVAIPSGTAGSTSTKNDPPSATSVIAVPSPSVSRAERAPFTETATGASSVVRTVSGPSGSAGSAPSIRSGVTATDGTGGAVPLSSAAATR
ncbi:hypothetical protein NOGI109294_22305 [Nocardiopsis gilva]